MACSEREEECLRLPRRETEKEGPPPFVLPMFNNNVVTYTCLCRNSSFFYAVVMFCRLPLSPTTSSRGKVQIGIQLGGWLSVPMRLLPAFSSCLLFFYGTSVAMARRERMSEYVTPPGHKRPEVVKSPVPDYPLKVRQTDAFLVSKRLVHVLEGDCHHW